jgi:tRNA modification GTPase
VIAAVLSALGRLESFRMAEPGEFTRRAFEHGRLDLTQVEALADLIYAETAAQRRQALAQVTGLLGERAETWRRQVIEARALIEAGIDFADEADVAADTLARAAAIIAPLLTDVDAALRSAHYGERLREGLRVAILGPPNAGKSTLLNRIARREAAIVSPQPGTTRDVIEVHLDLAGYPVTLLDTAGIRENTEDPIEREGMRRAHAAAARAHLVLWLEDAETLDALAVWKAEHEPRDAAGTMRWLIVSKIDRIGPDELAGHEAALRRSRWTIHYVSAADGTGIDTLVQAITQFAQNYFPSEPALVTRERQHVIVRQVSSALHAAISRIAAGGGEEIIAEDLRHAATHLGRLTGRVDVEEVLDVIFREFCIGK